MPSGQGRKKRSYVNFEPIDLDLFGMDPFGIGHVNVSMNINVRCGFLMLELSVKQGSKLVDTPVHSGYSYD